MIKKKALLFAGAGVVLLIACIMILTYFGIFWPNYVFAASYEVQGIDVSNHQKVIDWQQVGMNKNIRFVFIKATEGKDYRDKYFKTNWAAVEKIRLIRGAYHYFTTTSSGKEQAANFIAVVPADKGCLPPVVDIEVTGSDRDVFKKNLDDLIELLETNYKKKPILYVTYAIYDKYIRGDFLDNPIWIRDIIKPAKLSDGRDWRFWQYGNRGRIKGIGSYVDINAFNGSLIDLQNLLTESDTEK
ncbi:MAG: GH25 family lysozyme [Saccharofermentanales bacterium]